MTWQPIETAPKNRRVLLWYQNPVFTGCEAVAGQWDEDEFAMRPRPYWASDLAVLNKALSRRIQPTHWAELPEGPT